MTTKRGSTSLLHSGAHGGRAMTYGANGAGAAYSRVYLAPKWTE